MSPHGRLSQITRRDGRPGRNASARMEAPASPAALGPGPWALGPGSFVALTRAHGLPRPSCHPASTVKGWAKPTCPGAPLQAHGARGSPFVVANPGGRGRNSRVALPPPRPPLRGGLGRVSVVRQRRQDPAPLLDCITPPPPPHHQGRAAPSLPTRRRPRPAGRPPTNTLPDTLPCSPPPAGAPATLRGSRSCSTTGPR